MTERDHGAGMAIGRLRLSGFHWRRDPAGYRLARGRSLLLAGTILERKPEEEPWQIERVSTGSLETYYLPPSDPVHRHFAALNPGAPEEFCEFVGRYGQLAPWRAEDPSEPLDRLVGLQERLERLLSAIDALAGPAGALPARSKARANEQFGAVIDVAVPWAGVLPRMTLRLLPERLPNGEFAAGWEIEPLRLFDYMCVLAACELQGDARWRPCSICGRWMALGPQGDFNLKRDTCSDACRQQKRRNKQRELGDA